MREGKRKYDKEFKVESVKLITEGGHDSKQVSSDLGVNYDTLRRWVREYQAGSLEAFPGKGRLSSKDEETRILKRENERLKMERDILKKALAIFSKEPR